MNLIFLITGLSLCLLTTTLSLVFKTKKSALSGSFSKIIASFCFVLLAVFLSFGKNQVGYYASMPICLIIIGLVSSVVADFAFEAKSMYEFHQKQYLNFGTVAYCVAQIFNISALLTFVNTQTNLGSFVVPMLIIVCICLLLTLSYYFIATKVVKFNFKKHTFLFMLYCFLVLVSTILSCYFAITLKNYYLLILSLAFILFSIFSVMLASQHFGDKQNDKTHLVLTNSIYYVAQILLAIFIYFI